MAPKSREETIDVSVVPAVELKGSQAERLKALDDSINRLLQMRRMLTGDAAPYQERAELYGPYLHAPVWPWFVAGWIIGALFVLLFVLARLRA